MKDAGTIKWKINISASIEKRGKITKKDVQSLEKRISEMNERIASMTKKGKPSVIKTKSTGGNSLEVKAFIATEIPSPYVLGCGPEGVMNIIKWFPVVTEDRDWDHQYIIDALRFKISNTCNYIKRAQRHENWENDVRYMEIALRLMDRIWPTRETPGVSYEMEYSQYHISEHKWVDLTPEEEEKNIAALGEKLGKGCKRMEIKESSENFKEFFAKNKNMHRKAVEYIKKNKGWTSPRSKLTRAIVISRLKHEKARNLFFKILAEKLESWWN